MGYNWFRRMLLAYTPVFFVVVSFLVFIFYQTLSEQSRRESLKSNESLAGQALRYTEQTLKNIDHRILRESMVNDSFQAFLQEKDTSQIYVYMEAVKAMQDLKISFPDIDSIYLVRLSDGFVLSLSTSSNMESFRDRDFIRSYFANGRPSEWSGIREFNEFSFQAKRSVVTLARPMPFYSGSKGIIVINVDKEKLSRQVKEMYDSEVSFVRILDKNGKDLLDNQQSDSASMKGSDVLTRLSSDYTGWTIESGLIRNSAVQLLQSMSGVWAMLGGIAVFVGILWIVIVTRRAYKPLERLVSQIQVYAGTESDKISTYPNEFNFIGETIGRIVEQNDLYLQEQREFQAIRKKHVFEKLLKGSGVLPVWEQELRLIGMPPSFRPSLVFILEVDGYGEAVKVQAVEGLVNWKAELEEKVVELAEKAGYEIWCGWLEDRKLGGILCFPEAETLDEKHVFSVFDRWRVDIAKSNGFTVTFGLSEPVAIPEEVRRAYRECLDALQFKASTGVNRVILYGEIKDTVGELFEHLKEIRQIIGEFRLADSSWEQQLKELFGRIRRTMLRKDELTSLIHFLLYQLDRETGMLPQEIRGEWQSRTLPEMQAALLDFDTIDRVEEDFFRALGQLSKRMHALRDSRNYHKLMLEVRTYIEKHFDNPDLSLDYLSDLFDINPKYLSKLFKEEFGEKFVDFLIRLRMDAAKTVLETTDMPILAISEQVGYISANSFTRVFRRVYGISPGEYRKGERKRA